MLFAFSRVWTPKEVASARSSFWFMFRTSLGVTSAGAMAGFRAAAAGVGDAANSEADSALIQRSGGSDGQEGRWRRGSGDEYEEVVASMTVVAEATAAAGGIYLPPPLRRAPEW